MPRWISCIRLVHRLCCCSLPVLQLPIAITSRLHYLGSSSGLYSSSIGCGYIQSVGRRSIGCIKWDITVFIIGLGLNCTAQRLHHHPPLGTRGTGNIAKELDKLFGLARPTISSTHTAEAPQHANVAMQVLLCSKRRHCLLRQLWKEKAYSRGAQSAQQEEPFACSKGKGQSSCEALDSPQVTSSCSTRQASSYWQLLCLSCLAVLFCSFLWRLHPHFGGCLAISLSHRSS